MDVRACELRDNHHCGNVQLVVPEVSGVLDIQRDLGQGHGGAEVEDGGRQVIHKILKDNARRTFSALAT